MNSINLPSKQKLAQLKSHQKNQFYLFALNHLQILIDAYCHTGKEYFWQAAIKQRAVCEELAHRQF